MAVVGTPGSHYQGCVIVMSLGVSVGFYLAITLVTGGAAALLVRDSLSYITSSCQLPFFVSSMALAAQLSIFGAVSILVPMLFSLLGMCAGNLSGTQRPGLSPATS